MRLQNSQDVPERTVQGGVLNEKRATTTVNKFHALVSVRVVVFVYPG